MDFILAQLTHYGYPALFLALALGIIGLPVPDETLLTFCGYLIFSGRLHPVLTFAAGFSGSVCGITVSYFLGARYGKKVLARFGNKFVEAEQRFQRYGPIVVSIGYFVPGLRHFSAVLAGSSGLKYPKFALYAYSGAAVWITTFLTLGYFFGDRWQHTSEVVHRYTLIATGIGAVILLAVWLYNKFRAGKR